MEVERSVHSSIMGDVNDLQNINWDQVSSSGALRLPSIAGNAKFKVIDTMLQLL